MKRSPMRSSLGGAFAFCLVGLAGCKHADAPAPETTSSTTAPLPAANASAGTAPPAAAAAATSEVHDEDYDLTVVPDGSYATGKSGTVKIVLAAKGAEFVARKCVEHGGKTSRTFGMAGRRFGRQASRVCNEGR